MALVCIAARPAPALGRGGAPKPVARVVGAAGRIERGLRGDATAVGVPERVVSDLAEIFERAPRLRPGDEFRVLYEEPRERLLGARVVAQGRPITAVFFDGAGGGYYRPSGKPLASGFLRYPVEFTDITSTFSLLRPHPILRFSRPHLGVDLAAPAGTPVRAVARGTVSAAGG